MAKLMPVPEVAAGTTEVLLSEWLVPPGASVQAGDPVAVVETDKAIVEIEAETAGVLLRTLAAPGSSIEVGSPMALIGSAEEMSADHDELLAGLGAKGSAATPTATDPEPRGDVPDTERESPAPGQDPAPQAIGMGDDTLADASDRTAGTSAPPDSAQAVSNGRVFISPIARRLLREAGLDTASVTGTGPSGRIVRRDVERAIAEARDPSPAAASPASSARDTDEAVPSSSTVPVTRGGGFTEEPHSKLRRAVALRLTQSKQNVPHFYLKRTVKLDALMKLRAQVNEQAPVRISVNDFIIRAVAVAHVAVPDANVIWTNESMRRYDSVDISVAIASDRGLVTPVLRGVEGTSLSAISARVRAYVEAARAGRLQQKDLEGGSISVTNLGMFGIDEFAAIINPPQSAILAVGAARPTPVAVDGPDGPTVGVQTAAHLVLSVDHRAIDGALAAQWMDALVQTLENPFRLLI